MKARVAFASRPPGQPQILLMDEWIGAGDAGPLKSVRLHALLDEVGILVLASHNACSSGCAIGPYG